MSNLHGFDFVKRYELSLSALARSVTAVVLEPGFQCHRVIVFLILCAVHKGDTTFLQANSHGRDGVGARIKFLGVASLEFFPFLWVVIEPFAPFMTWCKLFHPVIEFQRFL